MEFIWDISNSKRWCCECAALHMPANLGDSAVTRELEMVSFHSNCKERQSKECPNYRLIVHIWHTRKELLRIPQARLQQNVNHEFPYVQDGFMKADDPEIKLSTPVGSSKKQENSRKASIPIWLCQRLWLTQENSHIKTWNILQNMGMHASQEILHPCKYNKYLSTWKNFSVNRKGELW